MKPTSLLILATLLFSSCQSSTSLSTSAPNKTDEDVTPELSPGVYTLFSLNVHDFVFPEQSIEAVNKVIDIHETYDVPIDIYLDDQVFQIYLEEAPELIERLKNSEVVTVGYHLRPPYPYYSNYDWAGLSQLSDEELYETILNYETHAIDLETGLPTEEPGGYSYLSEVLGYAPPIVATPSTDQRVEKILSGIYKEMGATYTLTHGKATELGELSNGLYLRPEELDYKLYEKVRDFKTGEEVFADAIAKLAPTEEVHFIGMKYHEDNFYAIGTPFWPIFWTDSSKSTILTPPYNLSAPDGVIVLRPKSQQEEHWSFYESTIQYASEHRNEVHPLSISDLNSYLGL